MAIGAYAQAHGKSFSEISLETVMSDGGVDRWADEAADVADVQLNMDRMKGQLEANAKMRAALPPMLAIGAAPEAAPKRFFPMLKPRGDVTEGREANIFSLWDSRTV